MIKLSGLTLKTFIYTFILIILVITVSFGILYFVLPSFYLMQKSKTLEKNADILEVNLNEAKSKNECEMLILEFAKTNNAYIIAFDSSDFLIFELSSPFLMMSHSEKRSVDFTYIESQSDDNGTDNNKTIISQSNIEQQDDAEEKRINYSNKKIYVQHTLSNVINTKRYLRNELINYITISSTLQPINEAKNVIILLIPYLLAADFLIALAATYIFANKLTKPILKISNAAAMMQDMTPGVLSNVRTGDELEQLSNNLDMMYLKLCANIQNLKSLEQSKADFMRAAGHELKTPIAVLNGITEGMIDNVGPYKDHKKYLKESKNQLENLARLVNEILTSSQHKHADELIMFEEADVYDILEEAVNIYKMLIEKKQIHITKSKFDFIYATDSHVLLNTLSNLISNAVKYTEPKGKIIISFSESDSESILSIENQCENIDNKLLGKLFEPFFILNYNRDKSKSGTGLGLYIVKKNLNALNLPYIIENTKTGLKFSIIFPA